MNPNNNVVTIIEDWSIWEDKFKNFLDDTLEEDPAHDNEHIYRVLKSAKRLAKEENTILEVVIPSAYLHDCVSVPKSSPLRSKASGMAAEKAITFLKSINYPAEYLDSIHHAIEAHSFTANIPVQSTEAAVVQDADRLDAIGAIGISRCIMTTVGMKRPLYVREDPFCDTREPKDSTSAIDHFNTKLLHLPKTMNTKSGRAEAERRVAFMRAYLEQLRSEID